MNDKSDAEKHWLWQAQELLNAFEKEKGRPCRSLAELERWAERRPKQEQK